MAHVLTQSKIAIFSPTEVLPDHRIVRVGRHYIVITPDQRKCQLANVLIDAIVNMDTDDLSKISALQILAKTSMFDMIMARPYSITRGSGPANIKDVMKPDLDYYCRRTTVDYHTYESGEAAIVRDADGSVHSWSPELTKVIEAAPNAIVALDGLMQAKIIGNYVIYELPWEEVFHFCQPKNSAKPNDFNQRGN